MANTIKLKRNSTAGQTPSSLEDGELAVNTADVKLFIKNASGSIVEVGAGGGGGGGGGFTEDDYILEEIIGLWN